MSRFPRAPLGAKVRGSIVGVLVAAALAGPSCAVLTVDVDVYKGPLANHPEVQANQLAVLAIGAKPLLVGLRDLLEESYRGDGNALRDQTGYADYIAASSEMKLDSAQAGRVNQILSLYRDLEGDDLAQMVAEPIRLRDEYLAHAREFERRPPPDAPEHWSQIERYLPDDETFARNAATLGAQGLSDLRAETSAAAFSAARMKLRGAYAALFTAPKDRGVARQVEEAHLELLGTLDRSAFRFESLDLIKAKGGGNRTFNYLLHEGVQQFHAWSLFGVDLRPDAPAPADAPARETTRAARRFVGEVDRIAEAFLDKRITLRKLYRSILFRLAYEPFHPGTAAAELEEQAVIAVAEMTRYASLSLVAEARDEIAGLAASAATDPKLTDAASLLLDRWAAANAPQWVDPWTEPLGVSIDAGKAWLRLELGRRRMETAAALLELDEFYASKGFDAVVKGFKKRASTEALSGRLAGVDDEFKRWFGLTVSDVDSDSLLDKILKLPFFHPPGLGGGRLGDGLETVIANYVTKYHASAAHPGDDVDMARAQMVAQLVQFAQKVLVLANHDQLLVDTPRSRPDETEAERDAARAGGPPRGSDAPISNPVPTADREQYVRVLQSIGNSILIQADELIHRRDHARALDARAERDVDELNRHFAPLHFDSKTDPREAIDQLIASFRYKIAHETSTRSDVATLKRDRDAIRVLEQHRSSMTYIRPSSAYVRNSHPTTSLQGGSPSFDENLLLGDTPSGWPIVGQLLALFGGKEAEDAAKLTAEIDQQFWDNINRVKVSGAGNTNYVLVKDDIGNWYVKGYVAETDKIISSMAGAAAFAMGGSPTVIADAAKKLTPSDGTAPAPAPANPPASEAQSIPPDGGSSRLEHARGTLLAEGLAQRKALAEALAAPGDDSAAWPELAATLLDALRGVDSPEATDDVWRISAIRAAAVTPDAGGSRWWLAAREAIAADPGNDFHALGAELATALDRLGLSADDIAASVRRHVVAAPLVSGETDLQRTARADASATAAWKAVDDMFVRELLRRRSTIDRFRGVVENEVALAKP